MPIRLRLLGGLEVVDAAGARRLSLDRPVSLLIYLALRRDWVSRAELALLYRPEAPEAEAISYVRKLVFRARRRPWASGLEAAGGSLRWLVRTDVAEFLAASTQRRWGEALAAHGGPFLGGEALRDAPGFTAWQETEREVLAAKWLQAAESRAAELAAEGSFSEAAELLGRAVDAEPLIEENVRAYMRALAADGREREALAVYDRFRRHLEREVGSAPLDTTQVLADSLRAATPGKSGGAPVAPPEPGPGGAPQTTESGPGGPFPSASAAPARRWAPLPQPATSFIGRERELRRIEELFASRAARLVTLVGLGGSGKTRLAIEAARREAGRWRDGAAFVPLAGVADPSAVAPAIIDALGLPQEGDAERALHEALHGRQLLLVLDNFEGVLPAAPLLVRALEAAPGVTMLVTSREALRVSCEWLVDLMGLDTPDPGTVDGLDRFDAVRLFVQRAVRVAPRFATSDEELRAVAELCRQLEGLPLAIEIAASWTRLLPVATLQEQLAAQPTLLTTDLRDLPERHRSFWRVFDYTYGQLTERERHALTRMTAFRGGFTLDAARAVAGADPELLMALLDRLLVRRQGEGRFVLHELVRQYAERHGSQEELRRAREAHSHFYCERLARLAPDLEGRDVPVGLAAVQADLADFEAAWDDSVCRTDVAALEGASAALDSFYFYRARFATATRAFARAAAALEPLLSAAPDQNNAPTPLTAPGVRNGFAPATESGPDVGRAWRLRGRLLLRQAQHERGMGNLGTAQELAEHALGILTSWGAETDVAHARLSVANCLLRAARYAEAQPHFRAVLATAEREADSLLEGAAYTGLAHLLSYTAGEIARAEELYRASLRAYRRCGHLEGIVVALINLGACRFDLHDFDEAERLWREAAGMAAQLGSTQREALLHNNLGSLAETRGDLASAEQHFRQSLVLRREIGDGSGVANVLHNMGRLAHKRGAYSEARALLQEALDLYLELGEGAGIAHTRSILARTLTRLDRVREASEQAARALELALAIDSHSDLLSALFTVALLRERQGEVAAALGLARAVATEAAGSMEPLRLEAVALAERLEGALRGGSADRSTAAPAGGAPAEPTGSVVELARETLRLLHNREPRTLLHKRETANT